MGNTATNVTTGKPKVSGAIFVAPRTATLPTDATSALSSDYVCLGFISEDGLKNSNEMSVNAIKAWGGSIVYRSVTELADEYKLVLIEAENPDVLKNVYGDNNVSVDEYGNITVNVKLEDPQERIWVFELALRGERKKRIVVSDGAVTARDEITYNDSDAVAYGITISAYPDASGQTHIEYIEGESHTVTFNSNGGSALPSQTIEAGGKATEPSDPTKAGYTFGGWYSDTALTSAYSFNTVVTANITLYAKWTPSGGTTGIGG